MALSILQGLVGYKAPSENLSRISAAYTTNGTIEEHCGACIHFQPPYCDKIAGTVVEDGWCRYFQRRTLLELGKLFRAPEPTDNY